METLSDYFAHVFKSSIDTDELMNDCNTHTKKLKSDADAGNPNKAWRKRVSQCTCKTVAPIEPKVPVKENYVRFVCISDTHTKLEKYRNLKIPDGDVLLHAGDFSVFGLPDEVDIVNTYLGTLPHKYKVIIAGNHDITFDLDLIEKKRSTKIWSLTGMNFESRLQHFGVKTVHGMLTDCIYLEDSMVEIYGIKIYGSPWTPGQFSAWGFQRPRGPGLMKKWNQIPTDTDILLTHCPPCGYGDDINVGVTFTRLADVFSENHVGCVDLLNTVQTRVKPKYHVYGHIHEGYGVRTDGTTTFINASTCTHTYDPSNPAIVFDVPLPAGYSKSKDEVIKKKNKDVSNNYEKTANFTVEGADFLKTESDSGDCDSEEDLHLSDKLETYRIDDNDINDGLAYVGFLDTVDEEEDFSDDSEVGSIDLSCSGTFKAGGENRNAIGNDTTSSSHIKHVEEDAGSLHDVFFKCSTFSTSDTTCNRKKHYEESDDEDSDIVFEYEGTEIR